MSQPDIDASAELGEGTKVWQLSQIREHARLGRHCTVGRGVYVGPGVVIGDHVKIQNHALVYEPSTIEDGVFIGPAVVLTNDRHPRAINPDGSLKSAEDWKPEGSVIRTGASLGARSVCVGPVTVGRWALVAAGAVVVEDVPDFALVAGVPARRIAWVGRSGERLVPASEDRWTCPATGEIYAVVGGRLEEETR